jgi:7-cyano-7-deazaguanine reductase
MAQIKPQKSIRQKIKQTKTAGRGAAELKNFKLGEVSTSYPSTYSPELLEAFENKHPGKVAWTTFVCTEFTSLCPKTGQPDFAKVFINYIADKKMVESKSLKLYLFSFRNHGDFHEDCVQKMCDDLASLMNPLYLEVIGEFTPRGGIAIFPFASYSAPVKKFQELKENRFFNYAPGKYSMDLAKLY